MTPTADPRSLQANPWNTNRVSPENERKIDESLRQFGMFKPILVRTLTDGTLQIIGGQHRVEGALRAKMKTVPIHNLGVIPDDKAKKIGLVDNGRYGEDDTLQLAELLSGLGTPEDLASYMPYSDTDLSSIFSSTNIDLDDLDLGDEDGPAPTLPTAPKVQTHQIMRFKVPVLDAQELTQLIAKTIKSQKFTEGDSLENAGDALVHLLKSRADA